MSQQTSRTKSLSSIGSLTVPLLPQTETNVDTNAPPSSSHTRNAYDNYHFSEREVDANKNATELFQLITSKKYEKAIKRLEENADEAATWHVIHNPNDTRECTNRQLPIHAACERLNKPDYPKFILCLLDTCSSCCKRMLLRDTHKVEDLVRRLVIAYPEGCKRVDHKGKLPIQIALQRHAPLPVIAMLLRSFPNYLSTVDDKHNLLADHLFTEKKTPKNEENMNTETKPPVKTSKWSIIAKRLNAAKSEEMKKAQKKNIDLISEAVKNLKQEPRPFEKPNRWSMIARSLEDAKIMNTSTPSTNQGRKQNLDKMFDAIKKLKQDTDVTDDSAATDTRTMALEKELKDTQNELQKSRMKIYALGLMNEKLKRSTETTDVPSHSILFSNDNTSAYDEEQPESTHPPTGVSSEEDSMYIAVLEDQIEALKRVIGSYAKLLMYLQEGTDITNQEWKYRMFENSKIDVLMEIKAWFNGDIVRELPIQMHITALLFENMIFDDEEYWSSEY
eukprot:CAMPEP_0172493604 /NCGR_PEP_ID=MMETSP1066-20121228/25021_1 /TAXON_ID=671091 /ORGANISM="Coscinodiscus wailesii, Strain CCMP2513" /LENGTH=504 /DNA_ID=CAMNT_0013263827 /DNA_START=177 /DNA_END=1692 /DNA_ORIENTATION=-